MPAPRRSKAHWDKHTHGFVPMSPCVSLAMVRWGHFNGSRYLNNSGLQRLQTILHLNSPHLLSRWA